MNIIVDKVFSNCLRWCQTFWWWMFGLVLIYEASYSCLNYEIDIAVNYSIVAVVLSLL